MLQVMLAVEILIALALVAVILLQRSEGGALGMGGGGGSGAGFGGFMSARGAANLLTRATAILATAFISVALLLSILAGNRGDDTSVFDSNATETPNVEELQVLPEDDSGDTLPMPGDESADDTQGDGE